MSDDEPDIPGSLRPDLTSAPSPSDNSRQGLSALSVQCGDELQNLEELLRRSDSEREPDAAAIHNDNGRFAIWAKNLSAFSPDSSRSSLQWRLRKASVMRAAVRETLLDLRDAAIDAQAILSGDEPNKGEDELASMIQDLDPDDLENRELIEFLSVPTTELTELIHSIKSSVNRLYKLAMLIRRGWRDRVKPRHAQPAPRIPGTDPALDSHILRLRDRYPRLDEQPRLLERLGQAFVERRAFILHQNSRFAAPGAGAAGQEAGREAAGPEQLTSLAATTFEERSVNLEAHEDWAAQSVRSGATSFVTAVSEGDDGELKVPELSRLTFHGVRLGHDEAFECPFCRNFVSVASARDWRKHIFADLRPYICTFPDCALTLFPTRHEWFGHELEVHRLQRRCHLCDARFPSGDQMAEHLRRLHADAVAESQSDAVVRSSVRAMTEFGAEACPFCDEWRPAGAGDNGMAFCRHLARHLQQVALAATQVFIEGLDIREPEDGLIPGGDADEGAGDGQDPASEGAGGAGARTIADAADTMSSVPAAGRYLLEVRDSKGAHITVSALYDPTFEISMISRRFHEHLGFKAPPVRRGHSRHYKTPMGPIAVESILSVEARISGREADAFVEHLFAVLPAAEAKDLGVALLIGREPLPYEYE